MSQTLKLAEIKDASAFEFVCDMEDDVVAARDFARVLIHMEFEDDRDTFALLTLSRAIREHLERIEERRGKLFHMLHPNAAIRAGRVA